MSGCQVYIIRHWSTTCAIVKNRIWGFQICPGVCGSVISAVTFQAVHSEINSRAEVRLSVYSLLYQPGIHLHKRSLKYSLSLYPSSRSEGGQLIY